jgi:high affinity Mn2+ porin
LSTGGYGFLLGDGALDFGPEIILECYTRIPFFRPEITLSPDYQFIINPAYNQARGPVHVLGLRGHVEF